MYGSAVPPAQVPNDWRATHVLAPARFRLSPGCELVRYEDPDLLRSLEMGFAELLDSAKITSLDIPVLRSKDRVVSQIFGRFLYSQGYGGVVFESAIPPGGSCVPIFEGRARLEAAGAARALGESIPAFRTVGNEFGITAASP